MFFSPYKNSRFVAKEFLKSVVNKHRSIGENLFARPWAHGYPMYMPDARFPISFCCIWYFCQRYFDAKEAASDDFNRTLIKRWGGTVDAVRKNLSPEDQARARVYMQFEQYMSVMMPASLLFKPDGLDLPEGERH
jgi:hypothetical protein